MLEDAGSDWNFGNRREDPIHRIHSYPARFPAFITTKALRYAEQQGVNVKLVADVFCGCGPTAVEAKRSGKGFWGCDINPIATLIARVKTRQYRDKVLVRYFDIIRSEFSRLQSVSVDQKRISDRIQYWFEERNIQDLVRLERAISRHAAVNSPYRAFFLCGFSNILKPTSRWLTKSIKAQRDLRKTPRGAMEVFEEQFRLMRNANEKNSFPASSPRVRILTRNFLASAKPSCRADLIVTSPPYVTSYNYADIHQLSTLWLRYAADYRDLRKNMVGNHYGVESPARPAIKRLGTVVWEIYLGLLDEDRRKAHSVARYFLDIDRAATKCERMLNNRAIAVFVIGNTRYKNVKIDNAKHLINCMERAGFLAVQVIPRKVSSNTMTPYRDARGRFTRDSRQRKVYSEEFVVIGRKR